MTTDPLDKELVSAQFLSTASDPCRVLLVIPGTTTSYVDVASETLDLLKIFSEPVNALDALAIAAEAAGLDTGGIAALKQSVAQLHEVGLLIDPEH